MVLVDGGAVRDQLVVVARSNMLCCGGRKVGFRVSLYVHFPLFISLYCFFVSEVMLLDFFFLFFFNACLSVVLVVLVLPWPFKSLCFVVFFFLRSSVQCFSKLHNNFANRVNANAC